MSIIYCFKLTRNPILFFIYQFTYEVLCGEHFNIICLALNSNPCELIWAIANVVHQLSQKEVEISRYYIQQPER